MGGPESAIVIHGAREHNLKNVSLAVPRGRLVVITGVSGSGKSSLLNETLAPALLRRLGLQAAKPGPYASLRGASQVDKVILIDQSPLGRTPRSNAAGRLGNADAALELVMTEQGPRAKILAQQLDDASRKRQEIEDRIVGEACVDLDARFDADKDFGLVVAHPHWHAGVIGIVASRIASRYNRPVVVIGMDDDGVGRGSCRSVPGFDLLKHLQQCSPMLRRYGGHAMAAGLEVDHSRIEEFAARFNEVCAATLSRVDQRRQLLDLVPANSEFPLPTAIGGDAFSLAVVVGIEQRL